jgi:hypothetical protein
VVSACSPVARMNQSGIRSTFLDQGFLLNTSLSRYLD